MMLRFPKVLVIDDDQSFTAALNRWLQELGYQARLASTAAEGARALEEEKDFEAVMLDLHLPDFNGHAILRQLKRSGINLPVIAMSGSAQIEDIVRVWRENAVDFLKKPFRLEELESSLDRAINAKEPAAPAHPFLSLSSSPSPSPSPFPPPAPMFSPPTRSTPERSEPEVQAPAEVEDIRPAVAQLRAQLSAGRAKIPVIDPQIAHLQDFLIRQDFNMQEVAETVGRDGALAAGVLRSANSTYYARGIPISSLRDACVRVGPKRVVGIALEIAMQNQFAVSAEPYRSILQRMWKNAAATSHVTALLAQRLNRRDADDLQISALLHNVGELLCICLLFELLGDQPVSLELLSREVCGLHEDFGAALARAWKLPASIIRIAGYHHRPRQTPEPPEDRTVRCIILASWEIASKAGYSYFPDQESLDPASSLVSLGLEAQVAEELIEQVRALKL